MSGSTNDNNEKINLLQTTRTRVKRAEDRRPEYDPDNLDNLTNNITWALGALSLYQDLEQLITAEIDTASSAGKEIPAGLPEELQDTREKIKALVDFNNIAWRDFSTLTDEIKAAAKREELEGKQTEPPVIISIGGKRLNTIKIPVDKVNRTVWNLDEIDGKKEIKVRVEKQGSKNNIDIPFNIDLSRIQEKVPQIKKLTGYEKRIWTISDALYRSGTNIVSYNQIYGYIGHTRKLENPKDKEAIDNAYFALNAEVSLDNREETAAGYKYPHAIFHGAILPNKRIEGTDAIIKINGKEADGVIRLLDKSDLLDFAIDRGQVAEMPIEIYQTPFQKTNDEIDFEDYILTWLIRAMDSSRTNDRALKMQTIYRRFNMTGATATDRKHRERLREKTVALLDYYKSLELVVNGRLLSGYTMDDSLRLKFLRIKDN